MRRHLPKIIVGALVTAIAVAVAVMVLPLVDRPHSQWTDPAAHVVDSYWLSEEHRSCGSSCAAQSVALDNAPILESGSRPVRAIATQPAQAYLDRHGQRNIGLETGGLATPVITIVEYEDGTRRVVGVVCSPIHDPSAPDAPPTEVCRPSDVLAYRVGEEPWR